MDVPITSSTTRPSGPQTGVVVKGNARPGFEEILTDDALSFVADLVREFRPRVRDLLAARAARQIRLDAAARGGNGADGKGIAAELDFLPATKAVRDGDWVCAPLPPDLLDRRVEITGPVDRKMVINALNSGANVFMADFEDSTTPTWENLITGQINLRDANRRSIRIDAAVGSEAKSYKLHDKVAVLFVRPRGWHLPERHFLVDGEVSPGSLVDFGLYLFHNARLLLERKTAPYFYLPKLESHLEARLWNDVFVKAENALSLPSSTIRATVLIETLPAAFEMDEILYELRDHSAGLNCGRWDYIFSFIKKRRADASAVLPDRAEITMDKGFLRAYSERLVATCHKRGVHAMGGMAAQIPIKDDTAANDAALAKVRADKLREVTMGHDGTWVAHPGLVAAAREIFDSHMPGDNQIDDKHAENLTRIGATELLAVPTGNRTEKGLRHNIRVGIQYVEAWLRGQGCVPLYHLMEDAATAEISRAQVWQWLTHGATLTRADGSDRPVTRDELVTIVDEEMDAISRDIALRRDPNKSAHEKLPGGKFLEAKALFLRLATAKEFEEFLTLPAYDRITDPTSTDPNGAP